MATTRTLLTAPARRHRFCTSATTVSAAIRSRSTPSSFARTAAFRQSRCAGRATRSQTNQSRPRLRATTGHSAARAAGARASRRPTPSAPRAGSSSTAAAEMHAGWTGTAAFITPRNGSTPQPRMPTGRPTSTQGVKTEDPGPCRTSVPLERSRRGADQHGQSRHRASTTAALSIVP